MLNPSLSSKIRLFHISHNLLNTTLAPLSMAAAATGRAHSRWARLLSVRPFDLHPTNPSPLPSSPLPISTQRRHFSYLSPQQRKQLSRYDGRKVIQDLHAQVERERQQEIEQLRKAAEAAGEKFVEPEEEQFINVKPLMDVWERKVRHEKESDYNNWEYTDSDSDDENPRYSHDAIKKRVDIWERKCKFHKELLDGFVKSETLDDAHKSMNKIEKFEERHLKLPLEYRVIGDMMNLLKESTGKERFILLQKMNRAMKLMECKEACDPSNPANYGVIKRRRWGSVEDSGEKAGLEKEMEMIRGGGLEEDDEDYNEAKEKDDILMEKLNTIEKKIEEKLEQLDHTFGRKGRVLEEEIKELVEERNSLTDKKQQPLYREGFDVKVISVNRTVKVTKGGRIATFVALLATGNYNGVVGFARAKGPKARTAIQRAHEKCFQNLHYVERHERHTIPCAIQAKYGRTKVYLFPAKMASPTRNAGRSVDTVLFLAGLYNVKSKIVGSTNPLNVMKALFIALNAIETQKDMQEKFGRTVVETRLL